MSVSKGSNHSKIAKLVELFNQLACDQGDHTIQSISNNPISLTVQHLEQLLGMLLDPMSFPELHQFAEGLKKAYQRIEQEVIRRCENKSTGNLEILLGTIGLVCFTLDLLNISEQQSQDTSSPDLCWSQTLLKKPAVQNWFKQIYAPSERFSFDENTTAGKQEAENIKRAKQYWHALDFDSLELYRIGTTSFILRCQIPLLAGEQLVLKCLLFPYTHIPAIADSTKNYSLSHHISSTVRIISSTNKWILMDFIEGLNLREFLQKRRENERQSPLLLRTDLLISIGKPLLTALTHLSQAGLCHEDLTPSNIIIHEKSDGSIDHITLIDLGRNSLYTRHTKLEANREALFVAPEIKAGRKTETTSDLYSFGMLLIELADPVGVQGNIVPDSLYQYAPYLARFIEDLIETNPNYRRLIFPTKEPKAPYADLCHLFDDLLKILPSEREMKPGKFFWLQQFRALFYPDSQVKHAWALWRMTCASSIHTDIADYTGWLFSWLLVSTIATYIIFFISLIWGARDFGMSLFLPTYINILQTVIKGCDGTCLPGQHLYGIENLPMRGVGLSIGLIQSAYYTNILAGLTTRSMRGMLARLTEIFLRFQTFVGLPLIAFGNLVHPGWWLALLIIGLPVPTTVNILCYQLATRILKETRGVISTVPLVEDSSLKNFGQWGSTLVSYIIVLSLIWLGLHFGILHDTWAYAAIIILINILIACISKSIILAPGIRGNLCRAFTLGERLQALKAC